MDDSRYGRSSLLFSWSLQYVSRPLPTVYKKWSYNFFQGLTRYAPIWPGYLREFFRSSIADGISYIETRVNFWEYEGDK